MFINTPSFSSNLQAVRREVFEESRVLVADVAVVGSQPWPVGRYGGCELMLGCLGKARNYEVLVNTDEVRVLSYRTCMVTDFHDCLKLSLVKSSRWVGLGKARNYEVLSTRTRCVRHVLGT